MFLQRVIVFGASVLWSGQAHAGAWNQKGGEGQIITTTHWARADGGNFDDDVTSVTNFTKLETRLWLEHGVTENLTLVLNGALQQISYSDISEKVEFEGFDDTEFGFQYEFARKEGLAASIRTSYILDGQLDEAATTVLSPGDMGEIRVLLGQSREISNGVIFHDTQLALRSGSFEAIEQVQGSVTFGYKPNNRIAIMLQGFANHRFEFVTRTNSTFVGGKLVGVDVFRTMPQSQIIGEISAVWQYKPSRYVQFGARNTFHGRNIVNETGLFIGTWTEY